jgi:ATPase subunit of ABC transporter with duplicated ATPase domains
MLAVSNISKSFGIKQILTQVSFTLKQGERAGLVGPNGCGKTTLLRILTGIDPPDSGTVHFTPSSLKVGYLPQGLVFKDEDTLSSFLTEGEDNLDDLLSSLEQLAAEISRSPSSPGLQEQYDQLLDEISRKTSQNTYVTEIVDRFGLSYLDMTTPVAHLSGGQKTRLALAKVILPSPDVLLLDEPTNHLDIQMLEWLESWLQQTRATVLVISHDRAFLDNVTRITFELDPVSHNVKEYAGNYSTYLDAKQREWDSQWQNYNEQQIEIQELKSAAAHLRGIAKFRKGGKADGGDKFAVGFFGNRSKGTVGRAKNIEKRLERILTDEHVAKPRPSWQVRIDFNDSAPSGRNVLVLDNLSVGYQPPPLLEDISLTLRYGQRVTLIGPNGSGKTTLLRMITGQIAPLAGTFRIGANVKIGVMAQDQDTLIPTENALEAVQRIHGWNDTEARSFLSKFLFTGDAVFTSAELMSYGERARLMLAQLVAQGTNLLLLDEPINHMDIASRVRFEEALKEYEGTILAVVHDRYFIQNFATEIWEIRDKRIKVL